ncbi:hypothetical protein R1flu_022840 [Riccia fluitans]|uniref:Mannosyltransferase n=1 Tax=Riccia fluitans TaxID=41844 RepID=A0ABD1XR09_9MARC
MAEKRLSEEESKESEDEEEDDGMGFEEMGLDRRLMLYISKQKLVEPTPIQSKAIPIILEGKDVVAIAKTGSGKTLAYLLPLVHKVLRESGGYDYNEGPRALVLVPTCELCQQVYDKVLSVRQLCGASFTVVQLTSRMSIQTMIGALTRPPDVIVASPASILACVHSEILPSSALLNSLSTLVLDKADLLLTYGFEDDLRKLARHIPQRCQCLLISATASADVEKLKDLVLQNAVILTLKDETGDDSFVPTFVQQFLCGISSAVFNREVPLSLRLHSLKECNVRLFDYLIATADGKSSQQDEAEGDNRNKRPANAKSSVARSADLKHISMAECAGGSSSNGVRSLRRRSGRPSEIESKSAEKSQHKIKPSGSSQLEDVLEITDLRQVYTNKISANHRWVWRVCLVARLLNALLVRTYFNPDEHWQSLEVAHRMVFGYGHLTWEWDKGIRSYVHPLIFAALYKVLAITGLDTPWLMARAPRLLQALFAAVCDVYLFKLTAQVFGGRPAFWALFSQMVNWFTFFCMTRTLSSSLETTLTIVALYYWPEGENLKVELDGRWLTSRQLALIIAAVSCAVRPTSAVIWLYVGVVHLFQTPGKFCFLLAEVIPIGVVSVALTALVDRWMYGYWTFVPLNFLKFNFLSSGADIYGTHPWHWYFSQGFTAMVFTFLPFTIFGIWQSRRWYYAGLIVWVLGVYSLLGHKEFRFVLPVLPLTMMFSGYALESLENKCTRYKVDDDDVAETKVSPNSSPKSLKYGLRGVKEFSSKLEEEENFRDSARSGAGGTQLNQQAAGAVGLGAVAKFWWILIFLFSTNMPVALYTSVIHQRGGEAVMEYLAKEARQNRVDSVVFLMPCHSTPFYSALHRNISMRFLDCSPTDQPDYIVEADRFRLQPTEFLNSMFSGDSDSLQLPSHIVVYDSVDDKVIQYLREHSYRPQRSFFHAHFPVDRELQAKVLLYALCRDARSSSVTENPQLPSK